MPPVRPPRRSHAFTLLELLTVIAVLAILSGFVFGMIRGTKQRSNIARTKAELALIVQALEDYKRHYGDYPQTGPSAAGAYRVTLGGNGVSAGPGLATVPARLLNALIGVYAPTNFTTRVNGPVFLDVNRFTLEIPFSSPAQTTTNVMTTFAVASGNPPTKSAANNALLDPWGNRYLYFYKPAATPGGRPVTWNAPSYLLYSVGPDGASTTFPSAAGIFNGTTQTTLDNADNIYADKLP